MIVTYRTSGPWGVGKGSNLSAAEADGNFYAHELRIGDLETSRPQPDNFANVSIDGTRISFTLVSGAVLGPLDLPVLKWRSRGEWAAATGYAANDTFRVTGDGLYQVLLDHVSAGSFDAAAFATGDTVAAGGFTIGRDYTILTTGTTDFTLIGASANTIGISFTATGIGAGTGTATINRPLYFLLLAIGAALPDGGTQGQILRKLSSADFDAGWQDAPALVTAFLPGVPNASERIRIATADALLFPADFAASVAEARIAASGDTTIIVNKVAAGVTTQIGEVVFLAMGTVGTWSSTGGLSHALAAGDILEWLFPSGADATLADISLTARAVRV